MESANLQWWWQNFGPTGVLVALLIWGGRAVWHFTKPWLIKLFELLMTIGTEHVQLIQQAKLTLETMPSGAEMATKTEIHELGKGVQEIIVKQKSDSNMLVEVHRKIVKQGKPTEGSSGEIPVSRHKSGNIG